MKSIVLCGVVAALFSLQPASPDSIYLVELFRNSRLQNSTGTREGVSF